MKPFLATFLGLIATFAATSGLVALTHVLFPIPAELMTGDEVNIELIPTVSYVGVALAHGLGLLIGLLVARSIDKMTIYPLYILAGFFLLGTVANLYAIPHPLWFAIADIGIMLIIGFFVIFATHRRIQN